MFSPNLLCLPEVSEVSCFVWLRVLLSYYWVIDLPLLCTTLRTDFTDVWTALRFFFVSFFLVLVTASSFRFFVCFFLSQASNLSQNCLFLN